MSTDIRFAVVGFGHIGKRHAEMIRRTLGAKLVGVADTDSKQAVAAEKDYQTKFYSSIEALLNNGEKIDVVNICTPNGLHAPQSLLALEKGCHVVCEKPMGLTKAECEEVIFKSLQMSKQVFCVMQNRYSPPTQWLKSLMRDKKLGKIFFVQISCFWNRDERYYKPGTWKGSRKLDGGPLFTQFSHFVDIMYFLFGDIKNIRSQYDNYTHQHNTEFPDDNGIVTFEFLSGGMGCFNYSTSVWDKNLESSITIIGEKGSVKVGGQYMDQVEYCHIDGYSMPTLDPSNPPNDYGAYKGSAANHHYVIENVVDTLRGKTSATTNALEGMKVVEIIERMYHKA